MPKHVLTHEKVYGSMCASGGVLAKKFKKVQLAGGRPLAGYTL
jgi:hypothetical protein